MPAPPPARFVALSLSCVSAAAAEAATYPLDAIKTQLQLQRSGSTQKATNKPAGALQLGRRLVASHGVAGGLYAGLSPAVLRHVAYSGTRITLYEQLRSAYAAHKAHAAAAAGSSSSAAAATDSELLPKLLFGLTAGGVGQLVAVPADLIKVQMQADVRAVMAGRQQQRRFTSISSVAAALVKQQGVKGLWRGGLPAVQRAALVNLGELSTYDSAKQQHQQQQSAASAASGSSNKLVVVSATCVYAQVAAVCSFARLVGAAAAAAARCGAEPRRPPWRNKWCMFVCGRAEADCNTHWHGLWQLPGVQPGTSGGWYSCSTLPAGASCTPRYSHPL